MRFLKKLRVLALLIIMASAVTNVSAANENNDFDWDPVVDAIIHVESRETPGQETASTLEYCKCRRW